MTGVLRTLALGVLLWAPWSAAPTARATAPTTGVVLVVTDVPATCAFAGGPRGPSPLVAHLAPGSFTVTCAVENAGVKVRRSVTGEAVAGTTRRIDVVFGGGAS